MCLLLCQDCIVLITIALLYSLKSGSVMHAALCFLRISLAIWGLLWFHTNFRIGFSISVNNTIIILIRIALDLQITLSTMEVLTLLTVPISEHSISFDFLCVFFSFFHQYLIVSVYRSFTSLDKFDLK